jgi:6-phosphogluconolactonase (cycloisomerase 2 family)
MVHIVPLVLACVGTSLAIPISEFKRDTLLDKTILIVGSHSSPYSSALPNNSTNKGTIKILEWSENTSSAFVKGVIAGQLNPSYVTAKFIPEAESLFLASVQEYWYKDNVPGGAVSSYVVSPEFGISHTGTVKTLGRAPVHLSLHGSMEEAVVATTSYGDGNISFYGVVPWQKLPSMSKNAPIPLSLYAMTDVAPVSNEKPVGSKRQASAHGNMIIPDPSGQFWINVDLGLDRLIVISQATKSIVASIAAPSASGPRHAVFHPRLPLLYTTHEISNQACVWGWNRTATGDVYSAPFLTQLQCVSTLPPGLNVTNSASGIKFHPSGKHIAIGNRGHDSILFVPLTSLGLLDYVHAQWGATEKGPRDFEFVSGETIVVACRDANKVMAYSIELRPSTFSKRDAGEIERTDGLSDAELDDSPEEYGDSQTTAEESVPSEETLSTEESDPSQEPSEESEPSQESPEESEPSQESSEESVPSEETMSTEESDPSQEPSEEAEPSQESSEELVPSEESSSSEETAPGESESDIANDLYQPSNVYTGEATADYSTIVAQPLPGLVSSDAGALIIALATHTPYIPSNSTGLGQIAAAGEDVSGMGFKTGQLGFLILETPFPTSVHVVKL